MALKENYEQWVAAKENGETKLSFFQWVNGAGVFELLDRQQKQEGAQKREQDLAAGGSRAEQLLLRDRIAELRRALASIPEERWKAGKSIPGETLEEMTRAYSELTAAIENRKDELERDLNSAERELSAQQIRIDDESWAAKRAEFDLKNPDRPYRLKRHDPKPGARSPYAAGTWSATSTKWGRKIYDGSVIAFIASAPSQNQAVVGLFLQIGDARGKHSLPFDPMDQAV